MIPKSLGKLSHAASAWAAKTATLPPTEADLDWLPPLLGSTSPAATPPAASDTTTSNDDESDTESSDEAPLTPSAARDLHALVAQLKSLTARLGALEAKEGVGAPAGWYGALIGLAKREGMAVGGATVAAVAAVLLWRRGRRR